MKTIATQLAQWILAREGCRDSDWEVHKEWFTKHTDRILALVKERMPSGGGFDSGTEIDLERSTSEKLVFTTSFHHMHESGMYDGWTEHTVTVKPSLAFGFTLTISGRNRNQIKEYIHECFELVLGDAFVEKGME